VGTKDSNTMKLSNEKLFSEMSAAERKQINIAGNVQALTGLGYSIKKK
jgi:hypothetical protein